MDGDLITAASGEPRSVELLVNVLRPVGRVEHRCRDAVGFPVCGEFRLAGIARAVQMATAAFVTIEDVGEPVGRQPDSVDVGPVGMVDDAGPMPRRPGLVRGPFGITGSPLAAAAGSSVGLVRAFVRRALAGFALVDEVELCASELATNAVRYGSEHGDVFWLVVRRRCALAYVAVIDCGGSTVPG